MAIKHFLSVTDVTPGELRGLLSHAISLKEGKETLRLPARTLALLFEKPSLRTRLAFEVAMLQLGGHCIYLSPTDVAPGKRESVRDMAQVIGRYVDVIAARTYSHADIEELASYSGLPVINALSDYEHPCQALADVMTLLERRGALTGATVTHIGDANNCATSLLYAAVMLGVNFRIASPPGYEFEPGVLARAREYAAASKAYILTTADPREAALGADAIYTDVWTSMGQEAEHEIRRQAFAQYQVTEELFSLANPDAILLHPLPAHHGEEVAEGLLYQTRSAVFDQAENRLHVHKAVLTGLLT